jgi:hypothetical protein
MLIIDNLGLKLSSKPQVYDGVLSAWVKAMKAVESILCGMAQTVHSPEVLIGLSSWHLYPDMHVFVQREEFIEQHDGLIPKAAPITLGLRNGDVSKDEGISWSLPLSRLRFYGKPTQSQGLIASRISRAPFEHLLQIAFGSAISGWGGDASNMDAVLEFVAVLGQQQNSLLTDSEIGPTDCVSLFATKALEYLRKKGKEGQEIRRRIALGCRKHGDFLSPFHPPAFFGLGNLPEFLQLLSVEWQIYFIRQLAALPKFQDTLGNAIIRYFPDSSLEMPSDLWDAPVNMPPELASITPQVIPNSQRRLHRRWITSPRLIGNGPVLSDSALTDEDNPERLAAIDHARLYHAAVRSIKIMSSGEPCGFLSNGQVEMELKDAFSSTSIEHETHRFLKWASKPPGISLKLLEKWSLLESTDNWAHQASISLPKDKWNTGWQLGAGANPLSNLKYRFLFGTPQVAVFQPVHEWKVNRPEFELDLQSLIQALRNPLIDKAKLQEYLEGFIHRQRKPAPIKYPEYAVALQNLFRAYLVYHDLRHAQVDLSVLSLDLSESSWGKEGTQQVFQITRAQRLACIVMFDSGHYNLPPEDLAGVVGVSSSNLLYVSKILLSDPAEESARDRIQCLIGNIGKAGISLLLLAHNPEIFEPGIGDSWDMVNHLDFDGLTEDNFRDTSLHLALTGDEMPLNVGLQGACDKEVFYVEATVRAYERGSWMADINVLDLPDTISMCREYCLTLGVGCEHSKEARSDYSVLGPMTSVDCWSEFLDRPTSKAVIRAKDNWQVRLALTAIMFARRDNLVICRGEICWKCAMSVTAISRPFARQDKFKEFIFLL